MRYAVLGVCVFATACAGQVPTSLASPSSSSGGVAVTEARGASELPFKGTLDTVLERDKRLIWDASRQRSRTTSISNS